MDVHRQAFKEETYELLAELETSLLELEETPGDTALIGRVFRAMHTIKGSGAMFGFDDIADFTHNVETVFDKVRGGSVKVTRELVNLTLSARDHIKDLLEDERDADETRAKGIIAGLQKLVVRGKIDEEGEPGEAPPGIAHEEEGVAGPVITCRIRFRPEPGIFASGTNPLLLLNELRELGECAVTAHTESIPRLKNLDPESCYIFWDIILTTSQGIDAIRDVFIFMEDECELSIDIVDDGQGDIEEAQPDRLGEILVQRGDLSDTVLKKALKRQNRIGEILIEEKAATRASIASALAEQKQVKKRLNQRKKAVVASSIRVPADKLDQLVALVGELVTVQARLSEKAATETDADLVAIAEEVEMLTSGLRDNAMSIRMLPIGTTFSNFKRLVRDLSNELGKKIELTTTGGDTELDKTVIERLKDPLVHIIRNSIDHGIESPDVRKAAGKPETGTIHLKAQHAGANVLIEISDNGKGLDSEAIRQKATEKGIIPIDADLTEKEVLHLIFSPGFSTASRVTDLSGRGVGMDVVKTGIEGLRGSIDLESRKGEGTTLTLKLPLTLAIIDGLLVTIGGDYFVLPLASVEECVELPQKMDEKKKGGNILNVRGEIVPYIRLRKEYEIHEDRPELEHVVIMEANGKRVGFVVDHVIGGHQTVIKNLGRAFKKARDISGATILGDGTVALIVDVNKILDV
ncbi:MAG: chemotaxis protein CheA [Desulfobacteraceae bacterium]|nr:chemotaxis protein CheA [Desulfobacteraceae bacterium]